MNVVNLKQVKNKKIEDIEEMAYEKHGAIKIKEDLYLYPECSFITGSADLDYLLQVELETDINNLLEKDVIEEINNIVSMREQRISMMLLKDEEGLLTFDIFNMNTNKNFLLTTPGKFTKEIRRLLTGVMAGAIKKVDIDVTFYLKINYEELKVLVCKR